MRNIIIMLQLLTMGMLNIGYIAIGQDTQTAKEELDVDKPNFSEEDKARLKSELKEWETQKETLFEELIAAVESVDKKRVYKLLKELHGGGAGPAGSEYELLTLKAEENKRLLVEKDAEIKRLERLQKAYENWDNEKNKKEIAKRINVMKDRREELKEMIQTFEEEAEVQLSVSLDKEMLLIFELLTSASDNSDEGR